MNAGFRRVERARDPFFTVSSPEITNAKASILKKFSARVFFRRRRTEQQQIAAKRSSMTLF